ncbi:MAG: alpha/beta hydrolase, partial [Pseudomonadota bacterium]|nr:alpha/beta hydrolase [Pseudomonadota bacterium]
MITLLNKNKLFLYCLVVIISSSFFASLIQTSFGKVDVKLMNLKTPDGQNLVYDLYKPSIATENDKQPFIVVVPGFQRSKEALSNIAIELSRRGYVVALIDPYAQGMSSSSLSRLAATTQGYGMFALVNYAYAENFSFVDINKIGSTGHSMGGNAAIRGADYFGKEAIRSGKKSKLDSVYISGYVLTLRENILRDSKSNMGVSYALYDEGAFRNDLQGWDAGNMKIAPESLRTVNSVLPKDKKVTEVELGKYYGEKSNNTLRVIFNEELLHPFQPYNKEATKNQLDYFDKVFGAPISINSQNQIWQYKEFFTLINMIVSLLMLIPIAKLFLGLNFFKEIVKDIPASLPEQTSKSKMIFWTIFFLSAFIACISFIPMVDAAKILFHESANRELTWFFPQRMNNSVMLWAAFNGSIGLVIFFISYYFFGRHHGVNKNSWGLQINKVELFKTIMLGLSIFICYYLILYFVYFLFHVDYRFWFMGVRIFQSEMLLVLVMYFPLFFIFFFSNSLRVNGAMRFKNQSEWKSRLIAGFANSLGLMMIIIIQYVTFAWTGT